MWKRITNHGRWIVAILIALFVLLAFFVPGWPDINIFGSSEKTIWNLLEIAIIPVVLAVVGYLLNEQSKKREQEAEKRKQEELKKRLIMQLNSYNNETALDALRALSMLYSLSEGFLRGVDLSGADLSGANFQGADIRDINFHRAKLRKADFRKANLSRADLSNATLNEATLMGANLHHANLQGANAFGADFRNADVSSANLDKTMLHNADLRNANLSDVNLNEINNIVGCDMTGIKYDNNTILPDGFDIKASGAIKID